VLTELAEHVRLFGLGPEGLIFTNGAGRPLRRNRFSEVWRAAAEPLGIPLGDGYHQLRHYYASLLIEAGESVKVVQDRLGHSSATMTLDVYGHLWPDSEDRTRGAVDAGSGSGSCCFLGEG
jgi:integrase